MRVIKPLGQLQVHLLTPHMPLHGLTISTIFSKGTTLLNNDNANCTPATNSIHAFAHCTGTFLRIQHYTNALNNVSHTTTANCAPPSISALKAFAQAYN